MATRSHYCLPIGDLSPPVENLVVKSVKSSEFRTKCLDLVNEVVRTGETLTITKDGLPVATLSPCSQKPATLAGLHEGSVRVIGDIVSPIDAVGDALS